MNEEQRKQYYEAVSKRCETKGREEHKHTVETLSNDTNLDTTHDDEMETKKYDSLYPWLRMRWGPWTSRVEDIGDS